MMRIEHIVHYLKDAEEWQRYNSIWCSFVCTICVAEISVDRSIAASSIAEHLLNAIL